MLNAWAMTAVLWAALYGAFGASAVPYLVVQAVVGFSLLEVVNYMEHYAMLRQKVGVGDRERYERVLPTGYAGMIVLAIVPAVWRRVIDARVVAHFGGDVSLANISPRKREQYLARYGAERAPVSELSTETGARSVGDWRPLGGEVLAARCPGCSYVYDVVAGDEHGGFAAGTAWAVIPADWCCPDCGVRDKADFVLVDRVDA